MTPVSKRDLFLAQGGKCFYCGRFMSAFPWQARVNVGGYTHDHFYPKSKPIPIPKIENKVLACHKCNTTKANTPPTQKQIRTHTRLYRLVSMV